MMQMLADIRKSICAGYSFDEIGTGEYLVHTGMCYDDGDELHIVMRIGSAGMTFTDEGHTLTWLSYEGIDFTDARMELLKKLVDQNGATLADGRIQAVADAPEQAGPALSSIVQAMLQAACLRILAGQPAGNE